MFDRRPKSIIDIEEAVSFFAEVVENFRKRLNANYEIAGQHFQLNFFKKYTKVPRFINLLIKFG